MAELTFPFSVSILSCLLGFLFAWIYRGFTIQKLAKEIAKKQNSIKVAELNIENLKEQLAFTSQQANGLKEFTYEQSFKVEQLEADNKRYFKQLNELNSIGFIEDDDFNDQAYDDSPILTRIKARKKEIPFDRLGYATEFEKDDLKQINGIGHYMERKLNALGIFAFRQVAAFTETDATLINDAIEFFPGQIVKDRWMEQAQLLQTQTV